MLQKISKIGGWLKELIFSADHKQGLRISRMLMTALVYIACIILSHYAEATGIAAEGTNTLLTAYIAPGLISFYALLRSGYTTKFKDPALTLIQCIFSIGAIAIAYWSVGPARGAVLMLLPLVSVFGMLAMRPIETALLGICTVAILGLEMIALTHSAPDMFDPQLEVVFFVLAATIQLTLPWVAKQIWDLRERIKQQRGELTEALRRVEELAVRDGLTGLYNRRHMQSVLDTQIKSFRRLERNFCVALVDLDHFKHVNDQYGHQTGDDCLRAFSASAEKALRETDCLGRWGGEEFLFVLADTQARDAELVLARLRDYLNDLVVTNDHPKLRIRFSAGISECGARDTPEQLVERADRALYRAKHSGRNRSTIGTPKKER